MKKLTSAIVASSLVLGLVGTASANYSAESVTQAANRMQALGLVQGIRQPNGSLDLALNDKLTRAQLVTIIVRAYGQADNAKLLAGAAAFPDTAGHWASGEIALAKNVAAQNGFSLGFPDGTFKPNNTITAAESVALLMKFLGIKEAAGQQWPMSAIQGALDAGIITADDRNTLAALPNIEANRGMAFYLSDRAFRTYKLPDGKTVYTKYVKTDPPVVTVDTYQASTTAASITLTGTAKGHSVLHVGFTAADVVRVNADGTWSATVPLQMGKNDIWVHALDIAGNATEVKGVVITRNPGAAASIEASAAAATVKAGASTDIKVVVKDAQGNEIKDAKVTGTIEGEIGGSFDEATRKYTAGTKPGKGSLVLKAGNVTATVALTVEAGALATLEITSDPATTNVAVGTPLKLTAKGKDAHGNETPTGTVTWTASNGIIDAAGNFAATTAGAAKVTATVGTISKEMTINVYSSAAKLAVSSTKTLVGNTKSTDTVTVTAQDANGFTVANYNGDITLTVVGATTHLDVKTGSTSWGNAHTVKAVNGVATFTVKSESTLTADTTARVQATAANLTGALQDISIVKPALTSFAVSVDVSKIEANPQASAVVTVAAKDQEGVTVAATGNYTLTVASSDTNVLTVASGTNVSYANGFGGNPSQNFTVWATTAPGAANINVTVKDNQGNTANIPVNTTTVTTSIATAATAIQLIGADGLTLTATSTGAANHKEFKAAKLDAAGNVLSSDAAFSPSVTIKDSKGNVSTKIEVAAQGIQSGVRTFRVYAADAQNDNAGTYTLEFSSGSLTKASTTVTVNPGAATALTLTADNQNIAGDGVSKVVLTATARDAKNNKVDFNGEVELLRSSGTTVALPSTVKAQAVNGVAKFTATATYAFGGTDFQVRADLNADGTIATTLGGETSTAVTVTTHLTGAPVKLLAESGTLTGKKAGETYEVKVHVKDGQLDAKTVTSDNGRVVTMSIVSGEATLESATATTVNGVATFKLTATKAQTDTPVKVKAESQGLTASGDITATFAAAAAARIKLSATTANLQVGSDTQIKAAFVDAFGNSVTGTPDIKSLAVTGSIGSLVLNKGAVDANTNPVITTNSTGAFYLNAATIAASGTITAADNATANLPVDPVNITVYNTGLAYRAQVQNVANVNASKDTIEVKVQLVDFNNQRLTKYEGADDNVPFKLKVTKPDASTGYATVVEDSYVDGQVTFEFDIDENRNAGTYKFEVEKWTSAELQAAPFGLAAAEANLLAGLQVSSTTGAVVAGSIDNVRVYAINPDTGADVTGGSWNFTASGAMVAFVKVVAVDSRLNLATTFNGTAKLKLTSASNMTLIGANSDNEVTVNMVNGFGTAQIQRSAGATGTLTATVVKSGTTNYDNTPLNIVNP